MSEVIAVAVTAVTALSILIHRYRHLYKKYRKLYEDAIKPKPKYVSPKALTAQEERIRWLKIRGSILLRDDYRCRECGFYKHLEVHHIIPKSKGGSDDSSNLITLCIRCHAKKHGFKNRENKRRRHTRRNQRKRFKKYIQKHHKEFLIPTQIPTFQPQSMEDVHPRKSDLSPEAVAKRRKLYEKWERNELNQT